jgi:serine/threonine-protein kinase
MITNTSALLFDKYEVIDLIKKDEHTAVYLANHLQLKKKIILKVLNTENLHDESILQRFKRESKILEKLTHPNIIQIIDFGSIDKFFYISFEYFESKNLRTIIKNNSLSIEDKKKLITQFLVGLKYAHQNKVIHRDLKPENILVSSSLELKIGDFGLAIGFADSFVTSQNTIVGTPGYMSPEQILGGNLTIKSDMFSAGIIIYELLLGYNPFVGKDINETINKIISFNEIELFKELNSLPEEIRKIIESMLRKEQQDRLEDSEYVLNILNQQSNDWKKSSSWSTIWKIPALAISISLIMVVAAWYYFFQDSGKLKDKNTVSSKPKVENNIQISDGNKKIEDKQKDIPGQELKKEEIKPIELNNFSGSEDKIKQTEPVYLEKKYGKLFVECYPWAYVYIDSGIVETTPMKNNIEISEGRHFLQLIHPNYPKFVKTINIISNELLTVKVNLDTLFGYLDCRVMPWGEIFLNGLSKGQTPFSKPLRIFPGNYKVVIKNEKFKTVEYDVKINQNQTYVLKHVFKDSF